MIGPRGTLECVRVGQAVAMPEGNSGADNTWGKSPLKPDRVCAAVKVKTSGPKRARPIRTEPRQNSLKAFNSFMVAGMLSSSPWYRHS